MGEDKRILYFAYGSNMSTVRLKERIPDAIDQGIAELKGYSFTCNKKSKDGSSKGNIASEKGASTWGVIFEIPASVLAKLDRVEGGYERIQVNVLCNGEAVQCETYISSELTEENPTDSYMELILSGAREHQLPLAIIEALAGIPTKTEVKK